MPSERIPMPSKEKDPIQLILKREEIIHELRLQLQSELKSVSEIIVEVGDIKSIIHQLRERLMAMPNPLLALGEHRSYSQIEDACHDYDQFLKDIIEHPTKEISPEKSSKQAHPSKPQSEHPSKEIHTPETTEELVSFFMEHISIGEIYFPIIKEKSLEEKQQAMEYAINTLLEDERKDLVRHFLKQETEDECFNYKAAIKRVRKYYLKKLGFKIGWR